MKLATAAWNALNKSDYKAAISSAEDCINDFRSTADKQEAALEGSAVPLPPSGQTGTNEKVAILNRGVLNDAAACFFIKGEASSRLGRKDDAVSAYKNVFRYKYARVYDPSGDFFWSPAEVAEGRLSELEK